MQQATDARKITIKFPSGRTQEYTCMMVSYQTEEEQTAIMGSIRSRNSLGRTGIFVDSVTKKIHFIESDPTLLVQNFKAMKNAVVDMTPRARRMIVIDEEIAGEYSII